MKAGVSQRDFPKMMKIIEKHVPKEIRNQIILTGKAKAEALIKAYKPHAPRVNAEEFKEVALAVKLFNEQLVHAFNALITAKPAIDKNIIEKFVYNFLNVDQDYITYLELCASKTFREEAYFDAVATRFSHYKKILKRIVNHNELKKLPAVSDVATSVCGISITLAQEFQVTGRKADAMFYAEATLEWLPYVSPKTTHPFPVYSNFCEKEILLTCLHYLKNLRSIANLIFYNAYKEKKLHSRTEILPFLEKSIEQNVVFSAALVNAIQSEYEVSEQEGDFQKALYWNNKIITLTLIHIDALSPKYRNYFGNNILNLKVAQVLLLEKINAQYTAYFNNRTFEGLTIHLSDDGLEIKLDDSNIFSPASAARFCRAVSTHKMKVTFENNAFIVQKYYDHALYDLEALILKVGDKCASMKEEKKRNEELALRKAAQKIKAVPVVVEITPPPEVENEHELKVDELAAYLEEDLNISVACSSTDPYPVKKEKVKTRPVQPQPQTTLPKSVGAPAPLTFSSLGFKPKFDEVNPDTPVTEIYGRVIAKGIFYVYLHGADLSRMTPGEISKHKSNIGDGKLVSPGNAGMRLVRMQESGLDEMTFKSTIPSKDARIWCVKEQDVLDEKGNVIRSLYRACETRYHKTKP